jgi:hypothetical protein
MKNKLAQLHLFISQIDQRYVQLAYFALMLAAFIVQSPSDGGGTGR